MHIELLKLGPITINSFGFMVAIGFVAAMLVGIYRAPKYGLDKDLVMDLGIVCLVCGFIGSKILYIIVEFQAIMESGNILSYLTNGFVMYGGIIGGTLSFIVYCKIKKASPLKYSDLILPSVAIAQGFGRIGCFLAGCCYGRETDSVLGVIYPVNSIAPSGIKLLPTQLFSSAGDFVLAAVLIFVAARKPKDGVVSGLYCILYGVGRFIIEIFRNDPRGNVGALSTSQFFSIFAVVVGVIILAAGSRKTAQA